MDTLSNVDMLETSVSPRSGLTPIAIPEATSSQTGVSVRYVHDAAKQWFVFRASYGRSDLAEQLLVDAQVYAYVARRYAYREVNGRPKKVLENLLPNLVFAYLTPRDADLFVRNADPREASACPQLATFLSYYYDHFVEVEAGKNPPLTVAEHEMENFIRATCTHDEHLMLLRDGEFTFKSDDEVEVFQGPFAGVCGRVIRARGQQRVLVQLSGIGSIGTAYIPSAFMRKKSETKQ